MTTPEDDVVATCVETIFRLGQSHPNFHIPEANQVAWSWEGKHMQLSRLSILGCFVLQSSFIDEEVVSTTIFVFNDSSLLNVIFAANATEETKKDPRAFILEAINNPINQSEVGDFDQEEFLRCLFSGLAASK